MDGVQRCVQLIRLSTPEPCLIGCCAQKKPQKGCLQCNSSQTHEGSQLVTCALTVHAMIMGTMGDSASFFVVPAAASDPMAFYAWAALPRGMLLFIGMIIPQELRGTHTRIEDMTLTVQVRCIRPQRRTGGAQSSG